MSAPRARARSRPRSNASATAMAWETVKLTVALTLMPAATSSSAASMPAAVAGTLMATLGATAARMRPCSTMRSLSGYSLGLTCMDRNPLPPRVALCTGARMAAAFTPSASMSAQAISSSVACGRAAMSPSSTGVHVFGSALIAV